MKYRTYSTDFSSLERELRGNTPEDAPDADPDQGDPYDGDDDRHAVDDLSTRYG